MAKIVDPDQLNQATEVVITTAAKTIQLLEAGNLNDLNPGKSSGVTVQAVYSFLKEEWREDDLLNKFKFPMKAIFEAKFEMINGWTWADQQSIDLLRDGGFRYLTTNAEYACLISLGDMNDSTGDLGYYQQTFGFGEQSAVFDKYGEVNENIQIYDGTVDHRDFLKVFLREAGKTYSEGNLLIDQDLTALTYQAYRLPLTNTTDIKISAGDSAIDTGVEYAPIQVDYLTGQQFETFSDGLTVVAGGVVFDTGDDTLNHWYFSPAGGSTVGEDVVADVGVTDWELFSGERQIGNFMYAFNRIVNNNGLTVEKAYEWTQRQLRTQLNINSDWLGHPNQNDFGTVTGDIAVPLLNFLGDTLQTNPGTFVDNFDVNDQNRIQMFDITVDGGGVDAEAIPVTSTARTFPFVSAGTITFSANLTGEPDADTKYIMFFTNNDAGDDDGSDFDTANAIIVQNDSAVDISGEVRGASLTFTYDYDFNVQRGGASAQTDVPVTITAQGLGGAEWVSAEFTITRAVGLSFPINAADERNYLNP